MCLLKSNNGELILVILLEQLTKHPPGLSIRFIHLDLSFKAKYGLLNLALINQLFSLSQQIRLFLILLLLHIFIIILKHDFIRILLHLHLLSEDSILLPDFIPFIHHVHLPRVSTLLLPHFHHLIKLFRIELLVSVHVLIIIGLFLFQ
jgi:hypothetical protein